MDQRHIQGGVELLLVASCPGGYFYNGLYREAPPERGTFFTVRVYKRVGISKIEINKRVGKSVIYVFKRAFNHNVSNGRPLWLYPFIY